MAYKVQDGACRIDGTVEYTAGNITTTGMAHAVQGATITITDDVDIATSNGNLNIDNQMMDSFEY